MRYFTICGKRYHLTEKNYKMLLKRFDTDRAKQFSPNGTFHIRENCICPDCNNFCFRCEIGKQVEYTTKPPVCIKWLWSVTSLVQGDIQFLFNEIFWRERMNEKVRSELNKLRAKMLALPKV